MKHICSLQLFAILSTSSGQMSSRVYMNGKEEGIPYATYQVRGGIEVIQESCVLQHHSQYMQDSSITQKKLLVVDGAQS